jgi:hypothetical protein
MTPRGTLWSVIGYAAGPGKRKQAVLRMGSNGKGRKQERDWDAVDQWVIYTHKDGTPSACVLVATLAEHAERFLPCGDICAGKVRDGVECAPGACAVRNPPNLSLART